MIDTEIKQLEQEIDSLYSQRASFARLKALLDSKDIEYISSGSSRLVYKVSDTKVLKIAKNRKGVAQNSTEADWALRNYGVAAEWYDVSNEYIWIESEFCTKARTVDFVKQTGHSFRYFCDCIAYYKYDRNGRPYARKPENYESTWDEENLLAYMYNYLGDFDPPIGDLMRISSYGINTKGELVLTDTGLSDIVYNDYYKRESALVDEFLTRIF